MFYHGSNAELQTGSQLLPHLDVCSGKSAVFVTTDSKYATLRAGKFDVNNFAIREDYTGDQFVLTELKPNGFKDCLDCQGYVYIVNYKDITGEDCKSLGENGLPNEFVYSNPVIIRGVTVIPNVLEAIQNDNFYKLNYYSEDEKVNISYFKNVTGGKEGYINRRFNRLYSAMKANNQYFAAEKLYNSVVSSFPEIKIVKK